MRVLPLLLVLSLAGAAARDLTPLAAMADAERAFARAAAERGIRSAFLEFLDDEAIGFQPALGNAKENYRSRPEPPNPLATKLQWEPRTGEVARSGDLGWLTGPFALIPAGDGASTIHGCYFSVWRRTGGGPWRVLIDVGVTTPDTCAFSPDGFIDAADATPRFMGTGSGRESLHDADAEVARNAARGGAATALLPVLAAGVRLHRNDMQPVVGRAAAAEWLRANTGGLGFAPIDGAAASSADLGYTYGRYTRGTVRGYYLRVWRRMVGGAWAIVADVESPER